MKQKPSSLILTVFITVSAFSLAAAQNTSVFSAAEGFPKTLDYSSYDEWKFRVGAMSFKIDKTGRVSRRGSNGRSSGFRIPLERHEELTRVVYFAPYMRDLLLMFETQLGDGGSGRVVRLDLRTLKPKWNTSIPAFNVPRGLIEDRTAYVAGLGFVGKFDLETGGYVWKHDNLYRKYLKTGAFNAFLTPQIVGTLVVFKEEDLLREGFDRQIQIDKLSGKIVKVVLN